MAQYKGNKAVMGMSIGYQLDALGRVGAKIFYGGCPKGNAQGWVLGVSPYGANHANGGGVSSYVSLLVASAHGAGRKEGRRRRPIRFDER
jgi:hypothetical protein